MTTWAASGTHDAAVDRRHGGDLSAVIAAERVSRARAAIQYPQKCVACRDAPAALLCGVDPEVLEARVMKVSYNEKTDVLSVVLKEGVPVSESDEDKPGVILDYDEEGDLVSLEILDASRRVTKTRKIEFETVESEKRA
jgi:uncharacterized protein YuzE